MSSCSFAEGSSFRWSNFIPCVSYRLLPLWTWWIHLILAMQIHRFYRKRILLDQFHILHYHFCYFSNDNTCSLLKTRSTRLQFISLFDLGCWIRSSCWIPLLIKRKNLYNLHTRGLCNVEKRAKKRDESKKAIRLWETIIDLLVGVFQ